MLRRWTIAILLAGITVVKAQLGTIQTNVPWRAGHVAVYLDPYVILYGGSEDTSESYGGTVHGSNSLWVWDSRNGSWYNAEPTVQSGVSMLPQVYFGATTLPSSGQMIVVGGNTTGGGTSGMLQKLDINNWSWSFPSSSTASPTRAAQFAITTVNNTIYTYGGSAVDTNGFLQSNAVLNDLYMLDANSFGWTSGSNGAAITGHSTCYIKSCNCLVVFGGTSTGNGADANANVIVYDLTKRTWNLQVAVGGGSSGPPGGRVLHTANCMDDKMIVYGGGSPNPSDSDVWVLDASSYPTLTWERIQMENISQGPSSRMGHTTVLDKANQKLYIFGGWGATATSDTHMYILDAVKWSWSKVPTTGYSSSGDSNGDDNNSDGGGSKTGAIVGGVVGGVVGAALIAALLLLLWRRRRKQQQQNNTAKDNMSEKSGNEYYARQSDHWYYDTSGDDQQSDMAPGSHNRKRVSKAMTAMTNSLSFRDSYGVRSELGDTERVVTGVLEELPSPMITDSGSEMATYSNGTRSYRDSAHNSKALLLPTSPSDVHLRSCGNQVPNEVLSQKPNEFSIPASRFAVQHDNGSGQTTTTTIPIEHYSPQSPTSITASAGAPLSSSMDVLQSVRSGNGSSMLNPTEQAMRSRDGITVTHATHNADNSATKRTSHDEDNTTYTESISYQAQGSMGPIRYIPPSSQQFSLATTTSASGATNDARRGSNTAIPLTHHQYPSSNMSSVPVARPITPDNDNSHNNHTTNRISMHRFQQDTRDNDNDNNENIYETVSPLEMLAALGRVNEEESGSQSAVDSNELQSSGSVATPAPSSFGNATDSTSREHMVETKKHLSSRHRPGSIEDAFSALAPLTSMLPRRYQLDRTNAPIIGPMNSILFINKVDSNKSSTTTTQVAIKSFGRREAWERECRTLIKLKSPHVVELLEVLTIQDESRTPLPRRRQSISSSTSQPSSIQQPATHSSQDDDEEDQVKYVTVLERLDETLGSAIRRARSEKHAWTLQQTQTIARNVIECLAWCHSRGIAFCDLKPSNIMRRSADASWKLIDFEASRTIGEECVGVITPRYCPPEVARATTYGLEGANGVVATPSVDLWALGCVIYELETKHALFAGNIKDETILHFISHPSPSTPILNNGLRWNEHKELYIPNLERKIPDTRTRQLIKMLLSREPSKRGSASTLLDHPYFKEQQ
ncbi:hypothetical protein K492DRAFT_210105 [Lichtheimia hyalospora FSU 10163]|nr:hypothetical protein K492DRAFT_210105 [Lichtheimia hyalospora FSU 10163]